MASEEKSQPQPAAVAPAAPGAESKAPAPAAEQRPAAPPRPTPAPTPPKVETPSLTPAEMITAELRGFLEERLKSGEPVTVEVNKQSFTGRLFRLMLQEGWIAMEHVDGRRRAFYVIEGGKVRARSGNEVLLPGGHAK